MGENTSSRDNGRRRPRGYAEWRPQAKTRELLDHVAEILDGYADHLPLTLRQIFYVLVAKHDYEKTERGYARLSEALVRARRARLIPFDSLRDDGLIVVQDRWYESIRDFQEEYTRQAERYRRDRQLDQPYRLVLWSEGAGMLPQLARVARRYSIPAYSAGGFVGLTSVRAIVDLARQCSVPLVLLHAGDFDPSGESVFEAMVADAQAFLERDRILASQRIIPVRVALTATQVATYELPTVPPKRSDSRTRRWQHEGTCQLEALDPAHLDRELDNAIREWIDPHTLDRQILLEDDDRTMLLRSLGAGNTDE